MKNATYARPRPPDMLPSGAPNVTVFRARQVNPNPTDRTTEPVVQPKTHRLRKPTLFVIAVTLALLSLFLMWQQAVAPWWASMQDQWHYGSSRITQMDANVGHNGESHFIAQYYKGAIVIIEIPYASTNNTHTYTIPGISTDGSTPVVLLSTTKDGSTGRLDLVVQVAGTNFETILYNTGSAFSENQ
ncbi:MAG TPA: hypothetical protein VFV38_50220 [Ktedonobacteraceae bacterium]|nr:hypothetical protein [Ktedonobacteraceae bacterium]